MKSNKHLIIGLAILLSGVGGFLVLRSGSMQMGGMEMMGQGNMEGMMNRMMGDHTPPGIDAADLPDPQSRGARLMARYCTQCHDLPPPALHTSSQWSSVFARMNQHMKMMSRMGSILSPSNQERSIILSYLRRHAAGVSSNTENMK